MKLGVHSATFVKRWGENIIPYIYKIIETGYKSVEVSLLGHNEQTAEEIGQLSKDLNIEITCTTGLSTDQDITSNDNEVCQRGIEALKNAVLLTKKMNSSLLSGVVFGPWGISKKPGDNKKEKLIIYFVGIAVFLAVLVGIKELSKGDFSAPVFLGFFTGLYNEGPFNMPTNRAFWSISRFFKVVPKKN